MKTVKYIGCVLTIALLLASMYIIQVIPLHAQENEPRYGGTLVQVSLQTIKNLNVMSTSTEVKYCIDSVYNGLLRYDFDLTPRPELAESWEYSPDGKTLTFHLVKNATFHDGVPMTSADVKYTLEELFWEYHPEGKKVFKTLDHIEAPDNYTIVLKLNAPFGPLLSCFSAFHTPILPKHLYEGTDYLTNVHTTDEPIGTGPFKLTEFVRGDHITLERNEDYWREGMPYLDKIIVREIPEESVAVMELIRGTAHYLNMHTPLVDVEILSASPDLTVTASGTEARPEVMVVYMNHRHPALADKRVRQAICYALDYDEINEKIFFDFLTPSYGPIPPAFSWCYNTSLPHYDLDIAKANSLLDDAGWPKDSNGQRNITLRWLTYPREERIRLGELFRAELAEVGITVDVQVVDIPTWRVKVAETHEYEFTASGLGAGPDPSIGVARYLTTEAILPYTGTNLGGYSNPEVDALFANAETETDQVIRAQIFKDVQGVVTDDAVCVWLGERPFPTTFNNEFGGMPPGPWEGCEALDEVWWKLGTETREGESQDVVDYTLYYIAAGIIAIIVCIGVAVLIVKKRKK